MQQDELRVCLLNDSFPPLIDGVANTVVNYASVIHNKFGKAIVATPKHPSENDKVFPFEVVRYPSLDTEKRFRYRTGYPFSLKAIRKVKKFAPQIIHCHCPIVSLLFARALRAATGAPLICTYHTKFDIEVRKAIASKMIQNVSIKMLVSNMEACDEVWVVSEGAGKNLREMGFRGEYRVMDNGIDFPLGRVEDEKIAAISQKHNLPDDIPVFLFVGRMLWYKGVKITLDALKIAKERGETFRMLFVGDGAERVQMEEYAASLGLEAECVFAGAIQDRELLRAYFCRADLFLFPSTYDTNGIVVREAAACALASVLIEGSCAAEGIKHGVAGFTIRETAESMADMVIYACQNRDEIRRIGQTAQETLYTSWETSVGVAVERYRELIQKRSQGDSNGKNSR